MDTQRYAQWQELHRRTVLGETLTGSELETYVAGCRELDDEESLDGGLEPMRKLREQIASAEIEQRHLQQQESELDARIAALEVRLDSRTRQLLGIGN